MMGVAINLSVFLQIMMTQIFQGLQKVTDLELEVSQLRETLTSTNLEVTRLKFKEKELEQVQARVLELESDMESSLETKINETKQKLEAESNER